MTFIITDFIICFHHGHILLFALCIPMAFTYTISNETQFNQSNETILYTEINRHFKHENVTLNHTSSRLQRTSNFLNTVFSTQKGLNRKRAAIAYKEHLWNYGVIPYVIDSVYTDEQKNTILIAMETWEKQTCLIFKEKDPEDNDYVVISKGRGCWSNLGKTGLGEQYVSLDDKCFSIGIVLHELGHTIGFLHEQSRPDRNKYIDVKLENVIENEWKNFEEMDSSIVDSLGEPYDFDSIMHYHKYAFSKNSKETIEVKMQPGMNSLPNIGQILKLSPGDIRQTKKLYNCPRCGSTLTNTSGTFYFISTLGKIGICQWRIKAANGYRIQLNIISLLSTYSIACNNSYLEIRDGHHVKSPSLGRYCGKNLPGVIVSSGRRMWIEFKYLTDDSFSAEYKVLCGGDIKQNEGFITSQGYTDNMYPPNSFCVWNITVTETFVVVLRFVSLDMENRVRGKCLLDYIEVRDGHRKFDKTLGKFCSNDRPGEIRSTQNKMSIIFVSDTVIQKKGFSVKFYRE